MTISPLAYINFFKNRKSLALGIIAGLLPAFGEGAVVIAALLILAQLLLSKGKDLRVNLPALAPLIIYLIVQTAFFLLHRTTTSGLSIVTTFAIQSALVIVIALGMYQKPEKENDIPIGLFIGLTVSITILGLDYIFNFQSYPCHAQAFTGNPQWAAAFLAVMTAPLYTIWLNNRFVEKIWMYIYIAASLVAVGAFSGARMSFYALSMFFMISVVLQIAKKESRRTGVNLLVSVIIGWIALFSIDNASSCGFGYRIISQVNHLPQVLDAVSGSNTEKETIVGSEISLPEHSESQQDEMGKSMGSPTENPTSKTETEVLRQLALEKAEQARIASAGASRGVMWHAAWDSIRQNILIGTGRDNEKEIASSSYREISNFIHVHNQFLSWLIWGGLPMLLTGLILIFGLALVPTKETLGLALGFPIATILISESIFALDFNVNAFILIYITILAASSQRYRT